MATELLSYLIDSLAWSLIFLILGMMVGMALSTTSRRHDHDHT